MQARLVKRIGSIVLAGAVFAAIGGTALAHPGNGGGQGNANAHANGGRANTRMRFHLDDHMVALGDTVTGPVLLSTKSDHHWVPFAGATLSVRVDGTEVA